MPNSLTFVAVAGAPSVTAILGTGLLGTNLVPTVVADAWQIASQHHRESDATGEFNSRLMSGDYFFATVDNDGQPVQGNQGYLCVDFTLDLTDFPADRSGDITGVHLAIKGVSLSVSPSPADTIAYPGLDAVFFGVPAADYTTNHSDSVIGQGVLIQNWYHDEQRRIQRVRFPFGAVLTPGFVSPATGVPFEDAGSTQVDSGAFGYVRDACGSQLALQVGLGWDEAGFGYTSGSAHATEITGQVIQVAVTIYYTGPIIIIGGGGGGNPGGNPTGTGAIDVTQAFHPHGGYWVGFAQSDGIGVYRRPHTEFAVDGSFWVAGGNNLREPRLAIEPYSSLLSCVFRGGTGRHAGDPDGMGGTLTEDDPYQLFRRVSFDDGATWLGDPADSGGNLVPIPNTDGMKHTREVFNHGNGERLHFYNDASTVDANGNPTGQGLIQVDVYDISNQKVGTFPDDGNGIGGATADDSSFDALFVPDATTFLSCVFTVGGNQTRYLSFDDGRTWLSDTPASAS